MNLAQRTADDWRRLRQDRHWRDTHPPLFPDLFPVRVDIDTQRYSDPLALERALTDCAVQAGWVERQSGTEFFEAGGFPADAQGFGPVVSAELAGDHEGWSVRVVASGWLVTHIREQADTAGEHLAHDTFFEGVDYLAVSRQAFGRKLHYRIYWQWNEETGWRQFAARLLGFEGGKP